MRKKYNVVQKLLSLVNTRYNVIERKFEEVSHFIEDLDIIKDVPKDIDEQEKIKTIMDLSTDKYQAIINLLVPENEVDMIKILNASRDLSQLGVDLAPNQQEALKELIDRIETKRNRLLRMIQTREKDVESLNGCQELMGELEKLKTEGFVDNELLERVFKFVNASLEDRDSYYTQVLNFNNERFIELSKTSDKTIENSTDENKEETPQEEINNKIEEEKEAPKEEIKEAPKEEEPIFIPLTVDKIETTNNDTNQIEEPKEEEEQEQENANKINEEKLKEILNKYHYDIANLSSASLEKLLNGDIAKIEEVFKAITKNDLNFLIEKKENSSFLTLCLLRANPELIDRTCEYFKKHGICNEEYIKSYKSLFFEPSYEKDDDSEKEVNRKNNNKISSSSNDTKSEKVVGRGKDFFENIDILKTLGYEDDDELIKNNIKVLTTEHKKLLRNIKALQLYEYPIGSDTFPLSALSSARIMELTDKFIELGEEQYILRYASRLTAYVDGEVERIYALKKRELPYRTRYGNDEKLLSYVTNLKLPCGLTEEEIKKIVPRDSEALLRGNKYSALLDKYLPCSIHEETLEDPIIKRIDETYMVSKWQYKFNGVVISRKKLLRNYEFFKNTDLLSNDEKDPSQILLVSAIDKSFLNMEEIRKVNDAVTEKIKVGGNDGIFKR